MALAPGQVLGRYQLLEAIGSGGMGDVYRARDTRFDRDVAIKSMSGRSASNPDLLRRFLQEAADAPRIVHPYVATVFDVFEHEGAPLLVMEHVKGRRLDAVVRDDRPTPSQLARYGQEIAEALTAIHAAGLVHRDLKPANVMVTDVGHVKVMDFGVARRSPPADLQEATTEALDEKLTRPGMIVGTVAYMSPEQVRGLDTDSRSDLFALGIILFEAVTGRHPFHGATAADTAAAILHRSPGTAGDRRRLGQLGAFGSTIAALLEKDRESRPGTAAETARRLQAASRELTAADLGVSRRPRVGLAAAGIAVAAALVGLLAWVGPWRRPATMPVSAASATRPAMAVLPFEFRSDAADAAGRGAMIADLLAASVGESGRLRAVSTDRLDEVLSAAAGPEKRASALERVRAALAPQWLVTGTLYREDDELLATVRLYKGANSDEAGSFQVRARRSIDLVERAAARLVEATGEPVVAGFAPARAAPRFASVDEAQLLEHEARRLAGRSDYGQAIARLEQAVGLDPGFVDAHVLLADLLDRIGYEGRSRETIQKALRLIGEQGLAADSRQALEATAVQGRLLGLPAGLESLRRLAQLYPDEPDTLLALARALHAAGKDDDAIAALDKAAALDPDDPRTSLIRGQILAGQGRPEEARAALDDAARRFQALGYGAGLAEVIEAQGRLRFEARAYAEAAEEYRRSGEQFRAAGLPIRALGADQSVSDMNLMLWRLDEAEAGYRRTLAGLREAGWYSQVVDTLAGLGGLLLRRGRMKEAETTLEEADDEARKLGNEQLRLVPLLNLANLYCFAGRPKEAARSAEGAIEMAREVDDGASVSSARGITAVVAQLEGRFDAAAATFEELAEAEARDGTAARRGYLLGQLAEVREWAEQPAAALDAVNRAIDLLEPLGPGIRLAYRHGCRARLLALTGRIDEATADLARAESMTTRERDLPQVRDLLQATRATIDLARGRAADAQRDVTAAAAAGERASLFRGAAEVLRAEAQRLGGDARSAAAAAQLVRDDPASSAGERVAARLVRARALAGLAQPRAALEEARAALAAAQAMALPLTQAHAAAIIVTLDPHAADAGEIARAGRAQLRRYLDAVPTESRDAVYARADLRDTLAVLGQ